MASMARAAKLAMAAKRAMADDSGAWRLESGEDGGLIVINTLYTCNQRRSS